MLKKGNVIDLENDIYKVKIGKANLIFAGVDDPVTQKAEVDKVIKKIPKNNTAILLSHEPDYADTVDVHKLFSLQLSGHSHGGQLILPILGSIIQGRGFKKYPLGAYHLEGMALYTNPGLGTHTFRLRYNCKPEITVFTLFPTKKFSSTRLEIK